MTQLADLAGKGVLSPVNFFSYFTILSNTFAVVVLLAGATVWRNQHSPRIDMVRGAATLYMTVTLIVFALLHRARTWTRPFPGSTRSCTSCSRW